MCVCVCRTGEIVVNDEDRTSVSHIYAIGAVQEGRLGHSGLSMQAGRLLAQRLYGGKNIKVCTSVTGLYLSLCVCLCESERESFTQICCF